MKEKAYASIADYVLDRRYKSKDDLYNVCLKITYKRERRYYPIRMEDDDTKIRLTVDEFASLEGSRGRKRKILERCEAVQADARAILKQLLRFNFEAFEKKFFSDKEETKAHVISELKAKAKELRDAGRLKTAIGYESTANSIENYINKPRLEFDEVTAEWLTKYEQHMLQPYLTPKGKQKRRTATTVGIYLRNLRHIVRQHLPAELYPFGQGKDKYEIPSGRNIKKALSLSDVGKIYHYNSDDTNILRYRDYWILSYLCNGANIKDLARLRYANIRSGETIEFIRSKTSGTKRKSQQKVLVPLTVEIGKILDKWKVPGAGDDYVLPILEPGLSQEQELNRVEGTVKRINLVTRKIAKEVGIKLDVTTYTSRHSFATIMMQSGASVAMISKALGHSNVNTTESYLGDFDDDTKRSFAAKLTAFQQPK